jgi:hypothetical protein
MSRNARVILIETDVRETFSVRIGRNHSIRTYCESCGADDDMIDLNAAVTATGIAASDLIARIAEGSLHSPKTATGHLLVCLASLRQQPDLENRDYEAAQADQIRQNAAGSK